MRSMRPGVRNSWPRIWSPDLHQMQVVKTIAMSNILDSRLSPMLWRFAIAIHYIQRAPQLLDHRAFERRGFGKTQFAMLQTAS